MGTDGRNTRFLDADAFLRTDQSEFGPAWHYELVRGAIVARDAAPSPEHGVILGILAREIGNSLRGHPCWFEIGSGWAPAGPLGTIPAPRGAAVRLPPCP